VTDTDAAADAFGVLPDPSRVAMLRELASQFYQHDGTPVGFAALRRAVGVDDPGHFNYHLGQLRGCFLAKRDDGYAPTVAGLKAVESAEAGAYTDDPGPASDTVDDECSECSAPMTATHDEHLVSLTCDDHGLSLKTQVTTALSAPADVEAVLRYAIGELWRRVTGLSRAAVRSVGLVHSSRLPP
jgi:hypothetical protein